MLTNRSTDRGQFEIKILQLHYAGLGWVVGEVGAEGPNPGGETPSVKLCWV